MLENYFQLGPIPANAMSGWYDIRLVILSYLVATFASYIALDITGRLRDLNNNTSTITLWICGGALAMGAGIWSMHFIGMLAFNLSMPMSYDPSWTALSMVVAIGASGFALFLLKARIIHWPQILLGGVILGFAIAAMHYTGMQAMTDDMNIRYIPIIFALSILIAIVASEAALWLALKSTQVVAKMRFRLKFVSAFIMGAAICGMHYTGMYAAIFTPKPNMVMHPGLNPELLSISIATVTFIILGVAFIVSTYKESTNQQLLLTARQAGMAEVASSVLHNVGNVLNSVSVSSNLLSEKIRDSKLEDLKNLSNLMDEHKNNLEQFIKEDPRGKHLVDFIQSLSKYWETEKSAMTSEVNIITKNVDHIKSIIATQQDLSRVSESEQVISIENLLEEAILISGIDNPKYGIQIEKKYESLKPVMVDKVKLLQVLVNLVQNAKESLMESDNLQKKISFKITKNSDHLNIEIGDNGLGIEKNNLIKIFGYGFTTKKSGHGFGLHTSAISLKEMAGSLKADSQGLGKGATFVVQLPYKQV